MCTISVSSKSKFAHSIARSIAQSLAPRNSFVNARSFMGLMCSSAGSPVTFLSGELNGEVDCSSRAESQSIQNQIRSLDRTCDRSIARTVEFICKYNVFQGSVVFTAWLTSCILIGELDGAVACSSRARAQSA